MWKPGETVEIKGDVTTLGGTGLFDASNVERMLGYGTGRLAKGYYIALLKQRLTEDDFQFGGIALRSDGRVGLPAASWPEDKLRLRVHDEIMSERGEHGYRMLQKRALTGIGETGEDRLAKILPTILHTEGLPPNVQYPMGGGALQWRLTKERQFLIAAYVDEQGHAQWPGGHAVIGLQGRPTNAMIEARGILRRYLQSA